MAILYDWNKIVKASQGRVRYIAMIVDMITYKRKPKSKSDRLSMFYGRDFSGTSFLINPEGLLEYQNCYTAQEIAQYIALASMRNYSTYLQTGNKKLKRSYSKASTQKILANRLLAIEGDNIVFLFEELKEK